MLFRYQSTAAYQQRLLEPDYGGRWGATLAANEVQDGFWYKVAGGDAETPEYRVRSDACASWISRRSINSGLIWRANETRLDERRIEAVRGTAVDVTVHVNCDVKDGWLQFENAKGVAVTHGVGLPNDPQGFVVHMTLDESSQYRVCFTAADGENFGGTAGVSADRRAGQGASGRADEAGGIEGEAGLGCSAARQRPAGVGREGDGRHRRS